MSKRVRPVCILMTWLALAMPGARPLRAQEQAGTEATHRLEGEAVLALADAAVQGRPVPAEFQVLWQNEFLKAQRGTFIPVTLTIHAAAFTRPAALIYVRAIRKDATGPGPRRERERAFATRPSKDHREPEPPAADDPPLDVIFPAELRLEPGRVARVSRGFTLPAGSYDLIVVVRERAGTDGGPGPKAAVFRQPLAVPDFSGPAFTTSSVIVAERIDTLPQPLEPDQLAERPYVIGHNEVRPAPDLRFRRNEELIVVFLIYHPTVTSGRKFDLQVEYHFFRKGGRPSAGGGGDHPPAQAGEVYFNRTDPQRFDPALLGDQFDPSTGQPVMAGQGVPLAGFEEGDYRLAIRITDVLGARTITRDVRFTVGS